MPATSRCEQCKKKLGLLGLKCKCGKDLCITHLASEEHECSYNYKEKHKDELRKALDTTGLNIKMEKI